ncbi:MAG: (E)-4-hydroxy-3-methylbut-2-enyl-diphosphate synthase [Treponema sp.]|nr:(E)-4-hydroxy-3-methylbut-2-enyl-diphosphate synthase [Treponema sp.]
MKPGRISRSVKIGGFDHVEPVFLGGGFPVVAQTMWKSRLSFSDLGGRAANDLAARIQRLKKMGCAVLRFAVPDIAAAETLGELARRVSMPLVADIHFDYTIALRCLDFPIAKIRINPGNIGGKDKVRAVLEKAASLSRPIRIGVNGGSLPLDLRLRVDEGALETAQALVLAAERETAFFDEFGFKDYLVSIKASSVADTIKANRMFAAQSDAPLHVGVTEAGPLIAGVARNTAALMVLLGEGIGDTIRVSLSDTMENEIIAGREILMAAAGVAGGEGQGSRLLGSPGVRVISCPLCGRSGFDTHAFTGRWQDRLYALGKNVTVAIMGCAVNGPGEARHADIGITGAGDKALIFRKGQMIRSVELNQADAAFEEELNRI